MVNRKVLEEFLEETFQVSSTPDVSYNGLQFEGKKTIKKLITGVDGTVEFFEEALKRKADIVLVHHGIFWKGGEWKAIDKYAQEILEILMKGELNLYAIHLPLDLHPELGNNAQIAKKMGITIDDPFGQFLKQKIGVLGHLDKEISVAAFKKKVLDTIGPIITHLNFGKPKIRRIGIVSGGGWDSVTEPLVAEGEVDAILTGEVIHQGVASCRQRKIHLISAGHYATETFGVKATGAAIAEKFGIEHEFIDMPTGL